MIHTSTQSTSRPRVKKDTIGQDTMEDLFKMFNTSQVEEFKAMCLRIVEQSSASSTTKTKFSDLINRSESKKHMLVTVTNYFLAGEGKGV